MAKPVTGSLFVVATPIADIRESSEAARAALMSVKTVIGEERRPAETLLKRLGVKKESLEILNEHTSKEELLRLVEICRSSPVALISDCGTPGFCDPGADLVHLCRGQGIPVHSVPGPSSLTAFLSVCGHRLDQFFFGGFLPAARERREPTLKSYLEMGVPVILLDTPYRLGRLVGEIATVNRSQKLVIGVELGSEREKIWEGSAFELSNRLKDHKFEFVLLALPDTSSNLSRKKSSKKKRPHWG